MARKKKSEEFVFRIEVGLTEEYMLKLFRIHDHYKCSAILANIVQNRLEKGIDIGKEVDGDEKSFYKS